MGFIKTVLSLSRHRVVPSLNFERPNPKIEFDDSPFFVNTQLREWTAGVQPAITRAGEDARGPLDQALPNRGGNFFELQFVAWS